MGKSTVAAQLAFSLAARGFEVGLLDIDICGPSVPKMLGLEGEEIHQSNAGWSPVYVADNLGVMSIGFMLPNPDDAVVWRGPRKNGLIKQFLRDVDWGELDYLIVDTPPGTSDEHISIAQYLKATGVDGAVVVTTPQEVALADVRKEINFCRKTAIDVLGVVENMKYLDVRLDQVQFVQRGKQPAGAGPPQDVTGRVRAALEAQGLSLADLGVRATVLPASGGGAARLAEQMGVRVLGSIPLVPEVSLACEKGEALADLPGDSPAKAALRLIVDRVVAATGGTREGTETG